MVVRNPKALMFEIQGARHMFSPEAKISCRRICLECIKNFGLKKMEVNSQKAPLDY